MDTRPSIKAKQERLYTLCHDYLIDNFHKFSEANKIKVATMLCSKMVPQKVESEVSFNKTPDVYIDGKKQEYNIGTEFAGNTEETTADNNGV